jgi:hypothetical protein
VAVAEWADPPGWRVNSARKARQKENEFDGMDKARLRRDPAELRDQLIRKLSFVSILDRKFYQWLEQDYGL